MKPKPFPIVVLAITLLVNATAAHAEDRSASADAASAAKADGGARPSSRKVRLSRKGDGKEAAQVETAAPAWKVGPEIRWRGLAEVSKSARIVPEIREGEVSGMRLYAVRSGGPFGAIGAKNGDVIRKVSDVAITSPEQALAGYHRLRNGGPSTITVERQGRLIELPFRLVD